VHFPEKEYIIGIFLAVHAKSKNSKGINYKRPTLFYDRLFYSSSPLSVITTPILLLS
jgi:hypothetical protein